MNRIRFSHIPAIALALAAGSFAVPVFAQTSEVVAQPNPDADRLAEEMRALAVDPRDMRALLSAAAISNRLDDTSAALAFYARAEKLEPDNPRIFAGRAAALVKLERPGEALLLFQQAEQRGLPMADYASDRGLAYDLMGAPHLAQREYRQALVRGNDDELLRRLALSLGIVGKPEEAMRVIDGLLRRSDRAAWRARAFILAMNGDIPGAERIASSMMPNNMGAALSPFFRRLPNMSPGDRAHAVHFGQMGRTPGRLADAQLSPQLSPYVPEPKPVQVAAATPAPPPSSVAAAAPARDRRSRRDRPRTEVAAAPVTSRPVPQQVEESLPPLPPPPQFVAPPPQLVQEVPAPTPTPRRRRVEIASLPMGSTPADVFGGPAASAIERPRRTPARPSLETPALAGIVDDIDVPESEILAMAVPPVVPTASRPAPEPMRVATASPPPETKAKPAVTRTPPRTAAPAAADAKGKKKEPPKPKPPAEPKRIWVQVAGGANEDTLPTTWKRLAKEAPAAFRGKSAWWTPLRATNRLLAGPFKTNAEAQTFVNLLKKEGMSAFVFTSEPGQKINKLDLK
ncbi:SPOR domain-containing protein [Sphingomonas sp. G-3-2-10]|uniref:SPOR domain-containing protein n=1 Tax=Sphingomonas sp. G-3-2-10 TaxID=2728838 RepID=UPI001469DB12|nr:SPOR domain-containing protein [Sphingomonas sp. G-3-2-10]NML05544.1 SPOR domain-containing protein [Sphingomonas sp. G-3-2-10]